MYYTEDGMCFTEEEYMDIQKSRRRSNWDLDDIPDIEGYTPQYSDLGPEDDSYTPLFSKGQGGFGYSNNPDEDFIIKSMLG